MREEYEQNLSPFVVQLGNSIDIQLPQRSGNLATRLLRFMLHCNLVFVDQPSLKTKRCGSFSTNSVESMEKSSPSSLVSVELDIPYSIFARGVIF